MGTGEQATPQDRDHVTLVWLLVAMMLLTVAGGVTVALFGATAGGLFALLITACLLVCLRRFDVAAAGVIAVVVFMDWFHLILLPIYYPFLGVTFAAILVVIIFFAQSDGAPLTAPPQTMTWFLLLVVAAVALARAADRISGASYYINVFLISLLMYLLGRWITTSSDRFRSLIALLGHFGALIGLHTITIGLTGVFLFNTAQSEAYLAGNNNFRFVGLNVGRAGSFLGNPDWDGVFLATLALLPLGLAFSETVLWRRVVYGAEALTILGGLLFTFTTGSWLALGAGALFFLALLGTRRVRLYGVGVMLVAIGVIVAVFRYQVLLLLRHTFEPTGLAIRLGAWVTAGRAILAYPLTGVGLGYSAYVQGTEPFRDPKLQYKSLPQPHNTYLELAAMAGLPLLLIFLTLLARQVRPLRATYCSAAPKYQPVIAGAIAAVIVLTVNSVSVPGWTAEPDAVVGWLLLGALTAPALSGMQIRSEIGLWRFIEARVVWTLESARSRRRRSPGRDSAAARRR